MRKILNRILLLTAAGIFFTSCEENAIPELTTPLTDDVAKAKFFFHAEGAPNANFYFDDKKISSVPSTTAGAQQGSAFRTVFPSNAYAVVPSGTVDINARDIDGNEIASTSDNLSTGSNYSVYLVGTTDEYEVFVMEDILPADDPVKVYWRFVHTMADMPFSVDAYAVRAAVPATETAPAQPAKVVSLGMDVDFKEGGQYVELEPGNYTFKIFDSTMDYDPLTTTPYLQHTVNVATLGRVYTTQIRGTYMDPPGTGKIDFWRDR